MQYEREKLVTENLKLVYYVFNRLIHTALIIRNKEDIISEGKLGLIKAANSFNENLNFKFATFAVMCIRNQMLLFMRKLKKQDIEVSLYAPIGRDKEGNELCLADVIEDKKKPQDDYLTAMEFAEFRRKQKAVDIEILDKMLEGFKQNQTAYAMGLSQSYISRRLKKMKIEYSSTII